MCLFVAVATPHGGGKTKLNPAWVQWRKEKESQQKKRKQPASVEEEEEDPEWQPPAGTDLSAPRYEEATPRSSLGLHGAGLRPKRE